MGLGTSHAARNPERGHQHARPLAYMASYLDALVAIGGTDVVARRIEQHLAAGATRVAAHPLLADDGGLAQLAALAEDVLQ
jgi:hypothetical protein